MFLKFSAGGSRSQRLRKYLTHKQKLCGPVGLGTTSGVSLGKPGLSLGQTQAFSLFHTVEAQFIPKTNPVCPRDKPGMKGGRESLCVRSLCAFSLTVYVKMNAKDHLSRARGNRASVIVL